MIDLNELQRQHAIWERYNFGEQEAGDNLTGVTEELGELAHAYLKHKQGIRGGAYGGSSLAKEKDAIGDMIIYLLGYCNKRNINLEDAIRDTWADVSTRDWKQGPCGGKGAHSQRPSDYR